MNILFKYTSRSRRTNFLRGYDSIVKNVSNNNYHVLISVENKHHDRVMHPLPTLTGNHTYKVNTSHPISKVEAINRDLNEFDYKWDILVNMSDDMFFLVKGFDEVLRHQINVYGSDSFLWFSDGNRKDELVTMSIMGRKYYERDNYIYHPSYKSLWCDNEATEVAKERCKYYRCRQELFRHLHPAYGLGIYDNQYANTESYNGVDRENYLKRKANGWN
jgi:hypothetical protein